LNLRFHEVCPPRETGGDGQVPKRQCMCRAFIGIHLASKGGEMTDRTVRHDKAARWMHPLLVVAGLYNLAWGTAVVLAPDAFFRLAGMQLPRYPEIWQCVGMIVGVYGIGYWIAASDPIRHWPIVLVGLLGKLFGSLGFLVSAVEGRLPWELGWTIITNDVVWWVPFAAIILQAWRSHSDTAACSCPISWRSALREFRSHRGASLAELSRDQPVLVIFLRHAGCVFCRADLAQLAQQRPEVEAMGARVAVVHMSDPMHATMLFERYGLGDVHRFGDPHCQLYRAFGLKRAGWRHLATPRVWWRAFWLLLWSGHGIGRQEGDGFRMSGAFVLSNQRVVASFRPEAIGQQADFAECVRRSRDGETAALGGRDLTISGAAMHS